LLRAVGDIVALETATFSNSDSNVSSLLSTSDLITLLLPPRQDFKMTAAAVVSLP
jgi:hypothetical protein